MWPHPLSIETALDMTEIHPFVIPSIHPMRSYQDRWDRLANMKYSLEAAYESRCDCAEVDHQAFEDLSRLIERLEANISEMEVAA